MRHSTWNGLASIALALSLSTHAGVATSASSDYCDVRYETIDLGTFDPFSKSAAYAINNRGHVTGNSAGTTFLWSCERGLEDIGRSTGRPDNVGVALNDRDQVVIMAAPQYPIVLPDTLLWERGKIPVVVAQAREFYPESITNSGTITFLDSLWTKTSGIQRIDIGVPVLYSHLTNLGRLGGMYFDEATLEARLFTWTRRDGVTVLGPPVPDSVYPSDVNDRGDLLVDANSTELRTAYIIDREGRVALIPLRPDVISLYASRINLQREVIGSEVARTAQPHVIVSRSFVWDPKRGFRNLSELFDLPPGNTFDAASINDWGWIVGNRRDFNASLLVPVPAYSRRFENLNRLQGPQLCRALAEVKVHRLLCSFENSGRP